MKETNLKLSVILLLGFYLTGLQAQEVIPTTGGDAAGSGGSVSYSIGQVVYSSIMGVDGSVSEGVQQMFEISNVYDIEDAKAITLNYEAYPNPVVDELILKVKNFNTTEVEFKLFNVSGKLIESKNVLNSETSVSMQNLAPAVYFLKVFEKGKEEKVFKIIKNK